MTDNTQPEALRLAERMSSNTGHVGGPTMDATASELRRQHARIAELEAQLGVVDAGGVQALSAAPAGVNVTAPVLSREAVIRTSVAAMPHTNPMVADDLLGGFTMHTEADDVIAIFEAGRASSAASPPAEQQATKETSGGFHVWRDISTAPKDGSRFVATGHNYGLYSEVRHTCVAQWFRGCWMEASDWNETSELKYLTHWMPLPSPPDDVAAPAEQPATTGAATPKGAATTGAPLGGVYAELPAPNLPRGGFPDLFTEGQMRDFADRTHALRMEQAAPKAAPGEQNTVPAEWLEQAYREGWAACRDAETIGEEAEDWAFGNSTTNSRMIDAQQAAPQQEAQEPCWWAADQVRIEKTEKNGWCAYLDIQDADGNCTGTINLCRGINSENAARALVQNWVREFAPEPKQVAAPQQEPCQTCIAMARTVMLDQVSFDRKPDCYGIRQVTEDEGIEEWEDIRTSPDVAREEANDMMATGRGEIYEVVPLWTTPQPAPAPLSDDTKDAARYRWLRNKSTVLHGTAWLGSATAYQRDVDFLRRDDALAALDAAIDAAIAAQGGKV